MDERAAAEALAAELDLRLAELDACPLCLLSVSWAVESGDPREIRRTLRYFLPLFWDEGLAAPVRAALHVAREAGVDGAEAALADLAAREHRAPVFRAVVLRIAELRREEVKRAYITSQN